jgi:cardiolipin synthase
MRARSLLPLRVSPPRSESLEALRRLLAEQAFSRAAGAPLVNGNRVDLLIDAAQNYPAWMEAIENARRSVHVEMYILRDDAAGRSFADLLLGKAREGVPVRLLYDWFGALGKTRARFWRRLRSGGVEVRCCNPPRLESPLAWTRRDHRKVIAVDGEVAFVSGLCIGQDWLGHPERDVPPWRDTGVAIRGPAVADVERAFAEVWATEGTPLPPDEIPRREDLAAAGDQALRVIATSPETTGLLRLDLLWAAIARQRLWLADAYFVGTPAYLGALRAAAQAGVDVRLLVPSASDIEALATFSRTQYRLLLESGVRVFEWDGPMMHAKTAVVDGHWARVGSTNLNMASWVGNWELDVCVDDSTFGALMDEAYLRDLERSTEIVLEQGKRVQRREEREPAARVRRVAPGSAGRAAAAALELGGRMGAAITQRALAPAEARSLSVFGLVLIGVALLALLVPRVVAVPVGVFAAWIGVALMVRARRLRRRARATRSADDAAPLR